MVTQSHVCSCKPEPEFFNNVAGAPVGPDLGINGTFATEDISRLGFNEGGTLVKFPERKEG